jgi:hypothetical protein
VISKQSLITRAILAKSFLFKESHTGNALTVILNKFPALAVARI